MLPAPRGMCDLRLELKENDADHLTAYSTFNCVNFAVLAAQKDPERIQSMTAHRMKQDAAMLSGALQDGSIHLRLEKTLVGDAAGCAVTSLTITPFGDRQLAAEWQDRTCQGGSILLQRVRS